MKMTQTRCETDSLMTYRHTLLHPYTHTHTHTHTQHIGHFPSGSYIIANLGRGSLFTKYLMDTPSCDEINRLILPIRMCLSVWSSACTLVSVLMSMSATQAQNLIKNALNITLLKTAHSSNWLIRSHMRKKMVLVIIENKQLQKQN